MNKKYLVFCIFLLNMFKVNSSEVNLCDELLTESFGVNKKTLENINLDKVYECLSEIGQNPQEKEQSNHVWQNVLRIFGGEIDAVPMECYHRMQWFLAGIPPGDFQNITIGDIEMVEIFGKYYGFSMEQLTAIADRVRNDWAGKGPEEYSQFDLMALKHILCSFNASEIEQIHADAYKEAASVFGEIQNCPTEVLQSFAHLAIQSNAFGPPHKWSKFDIVSIGIVVFGLSPDDFAQIPSDLQKFIKKQNTFNVNKSSGKSKN